MKQSRVKAIKGTCRKRRVLDTSQSEDVDLEMEVKIVLEDARLRRKVRTHRETCYGAESNKNVSVDTNDSVDQFSLGESSDGKNTAERITRSKAKTGISFHPYKKTVQAKKVPLRPIDKNEVCGSTNDTYDKPIARKDRKNKKDLNMVSSSRSTRTCKGQLQIVLESESDTNCEDLEPTKHVKRKKHNSKSTNEEKGINSSVDGGGSVEVEDHWTKEEKERLQE